MCRIRLFLFLKSLRICCLIGRLDLGLLKRLLLGSEPVRALPASPLAAVAAFAVVLLGKDHAPPFVQVGITWSERGKWSSKFRAQDFGRSLRSAARPAKALLKACFGCAGDPPDLDG